HPRARWRASVRARARGGDATAALHVGPASLVVARVDRKASTRGHRGRPRADRRPRLGTARRGRAARDEAEHAVLEDVRARTAIAIRVEPPTTRRWSSGYHASAGRVN